MPSVQERCPAPPKFVQWMDRLNGFLTRLCGAALGVMVLSVFLGVLVRFVFTHTSYRISVPWTEEVSRYLMIWTVFLGAAVAARTGKLIGVEFVVRVLPRSLGRGIKYLALFLSVSFYALLCFIGVQWVEFGRSQTSPVLEMPMVVINLAMVVGGLMMGLNTIALMLDARWTGRDIVDGDDEEVQAALQQFRRDEPLPGPAIVHATRAGSTA